MPVKYLMYILKVAKCFICTDTFSENKILGTLSQQISSTCSLVAK